MENEENRKKKVWEKPELEVVQLEKEDTVIADSCPEDVICDTDCEADCEPVCFAAGTQVTMADGSVKNIEDVKVGDKVLTFDHEAGCFVGQEVFLAHKGDEPAKVFTLRFEDGTELSIVGIHDLFEKERMKYVRIDSEHAEEFLGKHFYNAIKKTFVELVCVTDTAETTECYSIYTKYNRNSLANGMLSVPDDCDQVLNVYEFDENLKANAAVLAADFAKYGVYEYPANAPYTRQEYEEWHGPYLKVMVGKGLITWEDFENTLGDLLAAR